MFQLVHLFLPSQDDEDVADFKVIVDGRVEEHFSVFLPFNGQDGEPGFFRDLCLDEVFVFQIGALLDDDFFQIQLHVADAGDHVEEVDDVGLNHQRGHALAADFHGR